MGNCSGFFFCRRYFTQLTQLERARRRFASAALGAEMLRLLCAPAARHGASLSVSASRTTLPRPHHVTHFNCGFRPANSWLSVFSVRSFSSYPTKMATIIDVKAREILGRFLLRSALRCTSCARLYLCRTVLGFFFKRFCLLNVGGSWCCFLLFACLSDSLPRNRRTSPPRLRRAGTSMLP